MNAKVKGYILGAIAASSYGTNPLFALPLYNDGMSTDGVLFYRYLFSVPAVAIMLMARGRSFRLQRKNVPAISVMGILMVLSSIFLFESYNYMDAGIASTLLFVYPLMVAVIMALIFHERITPLTVLCLLLALGGIGLLFKSSDGSTLSATGTFIVMLSSLAYAIYIIGVNRPGLREIPTLKLIFYVLLVGTIFLAGKIALTPGSTFEGPQHWYMWGCVLALALFPTVISFMCTTEAIQCIGPTPTAILGALEPVTAVFFGMTVFGETLTGRDWLGIVLIVAAVSMVVAGGKITSTLVRFRRLFPSLRRLRRHRD